MPDNESFENQLVYVIERNDQGDCLCLGRNGKAAMATIDASDVLFFIPMVKDGANRIVPSNMSMIEQLNWTAMIYEFSEVYNAVVIAFATMEDRCPTYANFKTIYRMCREPSADVSAIWAFMTLNAEELRRAANAA